MKLASRGPIIVWLAGVAVCAVVVGRSQFSADLSAFLPRSPSPAQQVLVEQLREGVVSRLILAGIEGAPVDRLAKISDKLAASLRGASAFASVDNGEESGFAGDRDYLWRNRFLLSPGVTAERYGAQGLRESLRHDLQLLQSPAGMLLRRTLPADPGGEFVRLAEGLEGEARPARREGVWFSADGTRALLVAQTHAAGYDIDAQERALGELRSAFAAAATGTGARLLATGPGVFSVDTRERIRGDALRFSIVATVLIGAMLLAVVRSPRVLALALLPVATGALAGIAAVSLGFGAVHGITLGFGVTLIGEGVDYAIYLLTRIAPGVSPRETFDRIWPTLRLGVLTSICGFSALLLSGFSGLAQLGLFSIAGLVVAAAVTRWVLPALLPAGFGVAMVDRLVSPSMSVLRGAPRLRYPLLALSLIAAGVLFAQREPIWTDELASLSPVPARDQLLDQQLRADLGAPDVRHLVVVRAPDLEAALEACERIGAALQRSIGQGWLDGFESPAAFLPSVRAQRQRQAALPSAPQLRERLSIAMRGLPFRPDAFEPFLRDAAAARAAPLLDRQSLQGTHFALKVDSLLVNHGTGWTAVMPLRGVKHADNITREMNAPEGATAVLLDLKAESERLYRDYRREALGHALLGAGAIVALLFLTLRSPRRVFEVLAPLAAAVLVTLSLLVLTGGRLSIFHLVGLLLVVAVGSNYSLFFDRRAFSGADGERTIVSLAFACLSTVIGFGLLAFSTVPVLHAIGSTVAVGAVLALVFSAILSPARDLPASAATR